MKKQYWSSYHCALSVVQEGKEFTSKYCNNRWCVVCNRIRTAKLIRGYGEQIKHLETPHLVTLTIKAVPGQELKDKIDVMMGDFRKIHRTLKKRHQRGTLSKFVGVRKVECNYNAAAKTFNPHFHVLVQGQEVANALLQEWLSRHDPDLVNPLAQDVRPADQNSIIEVFKYQTKLIGFKDEKSRGQDRADCINPEALDTIFRAMRGRRTFQTYGGIKKVSEDVEEILAQEIEGVPEASTEWIWVDHDWYQAETGEALSEYVPGETFRKLLQHLPETPPEVVDYSPSSRWHGHIP
jgi:hypothetical protein